jgi:hypothetical protein
MGKHVFFSRLVTKDLTAVDSSRRLFEGVLTVEMKDKQNEITIRDELLKVLPVWMARGSPITDTHSNRVIGKGINFAATTITDGDGVSYPAITIQGEIFKDYELDDEIWKSIKNGTYKGLSFGGATKSNRRPIQQADGSIAYALKDLEHYEVAVCEEPAVPLALITQHNELAKSIAGKTTDRGNGQMCIQCSKFGCYVDKKDDIDKNGEEYSDTMGANVPEGRDEQGEAFKRKEDGVCNLKEVLTRKDGEVGKSSYGDHQDNKQDNEKSEELEADRSQGPNQDNGATYHGTDKGRSVGDSARYAEVEHADVDAAPETPHIKAQDEDNKEALEEAGLKEEKKLEYAEGDPDGPERKNKILPAIAAVAGRVASGAGKVGEAAGAAEALDPADETCKANTIPKPKVPEGVKPSMESSLPSAVNPKKEHMEHGSVADAALSNAQATRYDPEMAEKWKATIDLINLKLKLSPHYVSEGSEFGRGTKPYDNRSRNRAPSDPKPNAGGSKQYPKGNESRTFSPGAGYAGGGSGRDTHTKPSKGPAPKVPEGPKFGDKERAALDAVREKLGLPGPSSKPSTSLGTGFKKPKVTPNPSYASTISGKNPAKIGKALEILDQLKKKLENKGGEEGCSGVWTEPARGGFAGSEPGETREDEGRSHHDVDQPKHVNRPTNAEGAEGVKKDKFDDLPKHVRSNIERLNAEYHDAESHGLDKPKVIEAGYCGPRVTKEHRDPQLQGNNSEDGINGKLRTNQDEEAEAFKPTDDFDSSTAGSIGPQDVVRQEEQSEGLKKEQNTKVIDAKKRPKQVIHAEAETGNSRKSTGINDPGMGSGGIRNGAAYDNAQQDTSAKDQPRKVVEEKYTGEIDSDNGGDNQEFNKSMVDMLNLKLKLTHI